MSDKSYVDKVLHTMHSASLAELMVVWESRQNDRWARAPKVYRALAERILAFAEPLLAYDVIREGLTRWPNDVRLRQLQGSALARSGATERARAILEQLRREGARDEETIGMLGRSYKDLAAQAASPALRRKYLQRAAETYAEAYRLTGGVWTGINAATMNLLVGREKRAAVLAGKVRDECKRALLGKKDSDYWRLVVIAEAALILRDWSEAEKWYERAVAKGAKRFGDIQSSRRNARLILNHWKEDSSKIDKHLHVPPVVVFAGHMIDQPGRTEPRFPQKMEDAVARQIREKIEVLKPGFGFASAACGSDILFLEAMLERGAEISVVLPYDAEQFVRDSVEIGPAKKKWRQRFDRVLSRAARVITASNQRLEIGGVSYEFCNHLLLGLATIRCRQLDSTLVPLAVWNRKPGDGPGGAASAIQNWRSLGLKPVVVDLAAVAAVSDRRIKKSRRVAGGQRPPLQTFTSRVVSILFADAVGFSKLTEPEVPRFVEHFLGAIARLTRKFGKSIIASNTWGDGLYFVFDDIEQGGEFALHLADATTTANWKDKGLPANLNLRIALHAGPVYEFEDPITGRRTFSGTHVSRAARIEPITPAGQVYGSEAFAALAAAQRTSKFSCDYVGQTPMAKGYGTFPVFHVRRTR